MHQCRFRSDCAFAQSDLNLHWAHFWIAKDAKCLHADNEDSDQTVRMHGLFESLLDAHDRSMFFFHVFKAQYSRIIPGKHEEMAIQKDHCHMIEFSPSVLCQQYYIFRYWQSTIHVTDPAYPTNITTAIIPYKPAIYAPSNVTYSAAYFSYPANNSANLTTINSANYTTNNKANDTTDI